MVNPRLPAHFNHISQPIEKYKLLSMHFWVARRHAAELPVEPVTFRVRSFLFRINWLPRCGSYVLRLLLFNCSARSQCTSCAWRVAPRDETSRSSKCTLSFVGCCERWAQLRANPFCGSIDKAGGLTRASTRVRLGSRSTNRAPACAGSSCHKSRRRASAASV